MSATILRGNRRGVLLFVAAVLVLGIALLAYALLRPAGLSSDLQAVHDATSEFQTVDAVEDAGYAELLDADGIACIDHGDQGAMGIHYVHGDLVGDAAVDPLRPEAIIYEPQASGSRTLVGVEYVVFQESWDGANDSPPVLFGREFTPVGADNRYGIPAFYQLHAWVWRDNPAGRFADYNPDVTCENAVGAAGQGDGGSEHAADHEPGTGGRVPPGRVPASATPPPRLGGW